MDKARLKIRMLMLIACTLSFPILGVVCPTTSLVILKAFEALKDNNTSIPPDTYGAVGPNHVMTVLNSGIRIQTKTGQTLATLANATFWRDVAEKNNPFLFDPRIIYDQYAGRWVSIILSGFDSSISALLIAVSKTSDPTGTWVLFKIPASQMATPVVAFSSPIVQELHSRSMPSESAVINVTELAATEPQHKNIPHHNLQLIAPRKRHNPSTLMQSKGPLGNAILDYPNMGINQKWLTVSVNLFGDNGSFLGVGIFVFNKTSLYQQTTACKYPPSNTTATCTTTAFKVFTSGTAFTLVPVTTFGTQGIDSMYLIETDPAASTINKLRIYAIKGAVGNETITFEGSVTAPISWDYDAASNNVLPQKGSPNFINHGDSRMQKAIFRNGSLWCTHTVHLPAGAPTRVGVQWFELVKVNNIWKIRQRNILQMPTATKTNGGLFFDYPSLAVNKNMDVLFGCGRFSSNTFASGAYFSRLGTDPLNCMRNHQVFINGRAPYYKTFGGPNNRWGDYSNTVVDPSNDLDMWTIQEFADFPATSGTERSRWSTAWGMLKRS